MSLDISIHEGDPLKPAIVFIHGLGVSKDIWVNPPEARILGGLFPLKRFFGKGRRLKSLFHDLKGKGYPVVAWSQRSPSQTVLVSVDELKNVISLAKASSGKGVILIGHSRGGLVARKYLEEKEGDVIGLITISTPHHGSNMARWASYIAPLASIINPLLPDKNRGTVAKAVKRMLDFLGSEGVREVLPDSDFIQSLKAGKPGGLYCLSAGGTEPELFRWGRLSFPDMLLRVLPDKAVFDEIKKGGGDGLVSAESSVCPYSDEHMNFPFNHITILFSPAVRKALLKKISEIKGC
jgi:pimeloyl-ACP methyl ester carboxylesterase